MKLLVFWVCLLQQVAAEEVKKQARFVMRCNDDKYAARAYRYTKLIAPVAFTSPKPGQFDHIFYTEFLNGCDIDRACVADLVDAAEHGNDAYVQHYLQKGTVFYLPAYAKTPQTWIMKQVLELLNKYNASTKAYTLVHVADESNHWNNRALIDFYGEWLKVYRQTWHFSSEYTALSEAGQLGWIPLTHLRTPGFSPAEIIPSSQRRHNMTFRGNSKTNGGRRYHWKELQSHFQRRNSTMTGTVIKRSSFSTDPTNGDYLREMSNSRLCLGMKGLSPECYRFYESLECGCIPVFIDKYTHADYREVFQPWKSKLQEVTWRKGHELPFIWARDIPDFFKIYDDLMFTGEAGMKKMDAMQRDNIEWWVAAKAHFKRTYENILCSFNISSSM